MGDQKTKDHQPPFQEEREGLSSEQIDKITEESGYNDSDGVLRQTLRGDETKGNPDKRDVAGATGFEDTPHGREETKNDRAGAANQNG